MLPLHPSYKAFLDLISVLKGSRAAVDKATQHKQPQHHLDNTDEIITTADI